LLSLQRAIKQIRGSFSWDLVQTMRELQAIHRLPEHRNVVHLYEVHREVDGNVHFVFEYMSQGSLHDLIERRLRQNLGPMLEEEVRALLQQLLLGVQHLHTHGVIHRDIKPENILLSDNNGQLVCKVADFSVARHESEPLPITNYVSTRWYRAPEILLSATKYDSAVDIWAVGTVAFELLQNEPLFPGRDETDQLRLIFSCVGTPDTVGWLDGAQLLRRFSVDSWPELPSPAKILQHQSKLRQSNPVVSDFLVKLLQLNPSHRLSSTSALHHALFWSANAKDETKEEASWMDKGHATVRHEEKRAFGVSAVSSFSSCTTPVSQTLVNQRSKHLVTISPRPLDAALMSLGQAFPGGVTIGLKSSDKRSAASSTIADETFNPYIKRKHPKKHW
jgi:serine/threonine protein kinase